MSVKRKVLASREIGTGYSTTMHVLLDVHDDGHEEVQIRIKHNTPEGGGGYIVLPKKEARRLFQSCTIQLLEIEE
jgi:hypothetical protein